MTALYVGTLDCHLIALDAKSGAVRWDTKVEDNSTGHSITAAPLAIDGKIIIGISGSEGDKASGAIRAMESSTGKLKWEFPLQSPPWAGVLSTAGGVVFRWVG